MLKNNIKICIVKLSAMGDIIHAMVALQFIKEKYPNCTIDWIVEKSFAGVLDGNEDIDNILPIELKKIKKNKLEIFNQIKILKQYSKNNYDIVIDAQGLLKSAIVAKIVGNRIVGSFISGFSKSSIREGIASYFYNKYTNISYSANTINRNVKVICEPLGIKVSKDDILNKKSFLYTKSNIKLYKDNYIVFVVGASIDTKIYPKESFLKLANLLNDDIVVVWGNKNEYEIAKFLSDNNKNITISLKSNLDDLKYIIKKAKLVIGADTGPTHLAWGSNIPSITIFGNTPHKRNTYITNINKVIASLTKVDARKLDKNDYSIKDIDYNKIYEIANKLINIRE